MIKILFLFISHTTLTGGHLCNIYQPLGVRERETKCFKILVYKLTLLDVHIYQLSEIQRNNYFRILFKKQVCTCIYLSSRQGHNNI